MANQNIPAIQQKAGNVGIGTSDPGSYKLNVNGESAFQDHVTVNSAKYIFTNNISANATSTNLVIAGPSSAHTVFTVANVGIGTTSPSATLSVQGNTNLGNSYGNTTSSTYTTRISGHAMRYDASNRYGNYGVLILNSDNGWTSGARRYMLTNGLNTTKFAIIRSTDATTDPSFGDAGAISSGTADFVINNAGNIGIGTTDPAYKLDVNGGAADTTLAVQTTGQNAVRLRLTNEERSFVLTNNPGDDLLSFSYGGSNRLQFDTSHQWFNSGNVGIGTTSPAQKLHVIGVGRFDNNIQIYGDWNTTYPIVQLLDTKSGGATWNIENGRNSNNLEFYSSGVAGTVFSVVHSNGNVGIGTTSPRAKFEVSGDIYQLWADAERFVGQVYTDGNSYRNGILTNSGTRLTQIEARAGDTSGKITFLVGSSEVARMAHGGNIGIGTTSPESPLHILGGFDANNPKQLIIAGRENASSVYSGIQFERAGGNTFFALGNDSRTDRDEVLIGGGFGSVTNATAFRVFTGTYGSTVGSERLTILSGGNVGIGTTSPTSKLHVVGDGDTVTLQKSNNVPALAFLGTSTNKSVIEGGDTFNFYTGGSSRLHITNGGNVGIGTASPAYKLDVNGVVNATDYYFNSTSTQRVVKRFMSTVNLDNSGYTVICNVTGDSLASAVRITIQGTANSVVINVTADILVNHFQDILITSQAGIYTVLTLRVISNGNEAFSIAATTNSGNTCTCNVEVYPLNSESVSFGGSAQAGSTLTHTCRPGINISATGGSDGDFAASGAGYFGGALGLGAFPGNKLDVFTTTGAAGFNNGISIITSPGTYTSGHGGMIQFQNEDVITAGIRGVRESGWGSGMAFYVHNPSSGNTFNSTFVERMRINENGNVGIGTTSPGAKFEIVDGDGQKLQIDGNEIYHVTDSPFYIKSSGDIIFQPDGTTQVTIKESGNVGIGTTSPDSLLRVQGTARITGQFVQGSGDARATSGTTIALTNNTTFVANSDIGDGVRFLSVVNESTTTSAFSNICFRTSPNSSTAMLDMKFVNNGSSNSTLYWTFNSAGGFNDRLTLTSAGTLTAAGDVVAYSDARLKENIITIDNAIEKVTSMRGVFFNKKDDETKSRRSGVIAQEIQEILPEVVTTSDDGTLGVAYGNIVGVLIEAIKELKAEIDILKNK